MKKLIILIVLFVQSIVTAQVIIPSISARVDTSNVEVKKVYHLYKDYLNSKPDSIYRNPYWNDKENERNLNVGYFRVDRAAENMYSSMNAEKYHSYFKPKILQIDLVESGRYLIKTIFSYNTSDKDYVKHSVPYITRLYGVKNLNGDYKLENAISFDTRKWKKYNYKYINYVVHPFCNFQRKEAKKAIKFISDITRKFDLTPEPFTYYILPNSDELGKLYNFEYWTYYLSGQTNIPMREIFTSYGNENYPHEFVHILFPLPKKGDSYCPMIINEGLATWLGGPGYNESFESALNEVSEKFKEKEKITIDDIINFEFRNQFDNSILYVTGGVICQMVYKMHGKEGIWKLYNSTDDNIKEVLSELFDKPYEEVEIIVIDYIKNY